MIVNNLQIHNFSAPPETEEKKETFAEIAPFMTSLISTLKSDGRREPLGTGFHFYASNDAEPNESCRLLILNSSLCRPELTDSEYSVRFYGNIERCSECASACENDELVIGEVFHQSIYDIFDCPDCVDTTRLFSREIDMASLNLDGDYSDYECDDSPVCSRFLDEESLLSDSDDQPFMGQEVYFLGYPRDSFDAVNVFPVLRRASIASNPAIDFNRLPQFLIDTEVTVGSNGSPVFAKLSDGQYKIVGIIATPSGESGQLARVNKVSELKKLIQLTFEQKRRRENQEREEEEEAQESKEGEDAFKRMLKAFLLLNQ